MEVKKQPTGFERCIISATRCLKNVSEALAAAKIHVRRGNIQGAYDAAFEAADYAEKLASLCREMPAYTGYPHAREMIEDAMLKNFPVDIGFTAENWFCVRVLALMPKKNQGSTAYISDPLYLAMKHFWRGKQPVRYPYNVIVFRHIYNRDRPERQYRDHDNTELSAVLDIVALYVMVDDSPMRCRHYYCSAPGSKERTEVYVIPTGDFRHWLEQEDSIPDQGVKLYENISKHI